MYRYLKVYDGFTSGTLGDQDGYSEKQFQVFEDIEKLAACAGTKEGEEYYLLDKVDLTDAIAAAKELMARWAEAEERAKNLAELNRLKKKLGVP